MIKLRKIIYYIIILILFVIFDKVLYLITSNKNNMDSYVNLLENNDIKNELNYITKLNYDKYDYIYGKITYKNLYSSNSYFIETNEELEDKIVLNDKGMIGILNNKTLTLVKDLSIGVKVNDNLGILKNNKVEIIPSNYNIGDLVYTSGVGKVSSSFLIGYVKNIEKTSSKDILDITYLDINNSYVIILK